MSLSNKVVIVTGASSGIGAAIALKFTEEGANVTIVGRNEEKLKNVTENIAKVGNKPLAIIADVTKEDDVQRIVNDTLKRFGKLDILVNNAGAIANSDITEENAMKIYDNMMNTNLRSAVYLTHLTSKYLIETKGNIINISSVLGQMVGNKRFAYGASKAGMDHFTRCIALDLAPNGVRVNAISPGPVITDLGKNMGLSEETLAAGYKHMKEIIPLKRFSEAVEVAELALFLASDKAVGITGSNYLIDNGRLVGGR